MNKFLWWLIFALLVIGIFGTSDLVYREFTQQNVCPSLFGIPACYVIIVCFIVPFIAHLFGSFKVLYFLFTGLALGIAIYASIMQILGYLECPKMGSNIPMCFISFGMFLVLVLSKLFILRRENCEME